MVGEHDQPLAGGAEVVDPGERGVELAARGEQLERVQPHQALGAQRGGDLRVELAQVERLTAQPGHEVALGEPVLGLVVQLDRHDRARLRRQLREHVGLQAAHEAARAQMPVQAQVGVRRRGSAAPNRTPEPKSSSRPRMRSWEISSAGRLVTGVPVSASTRPSRGTAADKPLDGLGALGGGVLAVVGLVEHERARPQRAQLVQARGEDVVVDDRDVRGAAPAAPRAVARQRARRCVPAASARARAAS